MKILGHNIDIVRDMTTDEMAGAIGRWVPTVMQIQVACDSCSEQRDTTLLHEVIEAINSMLKLELNEQQIMGMEASLYAIFKDNGVDLSGLWK